MLEINLDTSSLDRGLSQLLQNVSHPRKIMKAIATEMTSLTEEKLRKRKFSVETDGNKANAQLKAGRLCN